MGKYLVVMLALLCIGCVGRPTDGAPAVVLFVDFKTESHLSHSDDPTIIRTRFVKINVEVLTGPNAPSLVSLNLFEDVMLKAARDRVESHASGSIGWIGHIVGKEHSQVTFVLKDEVLVGNITLPEAFYQVRYVENGIHAIHEIDQSAFPPD